MGTVGLGGIQVQLRGAAEHMEAGVELLGDDPGLVVVVSDSGRFSVGKYQGEWVVGFLGARR